MIKMTQETSPKFNLDYPELTARTYGVGIHNDTDLTIVDPVQFLLAAAYLTPKKEIFDLVSAFHHYPVGHILTEEDITSTRVLKVGKAEEDFIRKRKSYQDFTPEELPFGLEERIRDEGDHKIIWGTDGRAVKKTGLDEIAHAGGVMLSGQAASKKKGYMDVNIYGPYTSSRFLLQKIVSSSEHAKFSGRKMGYTNISVTDFSAALMMLWAQAHAEKIDGFKQQEQRRDNLEFYLPFRISKRHIAEVLVARYIMDMTLPEISARLLKRDDIYDPKTASLLESGKSDFQVLPNSDYTHIYHAELRQLYDGIRAQLEKSGFTLSGYAYEKKGTPYQTVALRFEKTTTKGTQIMDVVTQGGPPLIVRRSIPRGSQFSLPSETEDPSNLWQDLYNEPEQKRDDKYGRQGSYDVRLPLHPGIFIPKPLWQDYKTAIRHYFKGDMGEFQRRITARYKEGNLPGQTFKRIYSLIGRQK
ncbi:MAG: hypothetical protein ABIJ08_00375 [Nanoarchaeota archaeon]